MAITLDMAVSGNLVLGQRIIYSLATNKMNRSSIRTTKQGQTDPQISLPLLLQSSLSSL
ncbi:hypothetical protein J7E78_01620 [Paenibacillus polymyxa]|uniref:hypothetical protein n=1 Tax=Paenibacillus polymyxa TaxID=1406 RepID=UPI001BEB1CD5|nr:hypothetical protein [Paenibacillus polymyxa]MBT2282251.1 hypothetical protein [Paenibacillus polymyxa]